MTWSVEAKKQDMKVKKGQLSTTSMEADGLKDKRNSPKAK